MAQSASSCFGFVVDVESRLQNASKIVAFGLRYLPGVASASTLEFLSRESLCFRIAFHRLLID